MIRFSRPWVLATYAGKLRGRFVASWKDLPAANRKRWTLTICTGILALFAGMAGLVQLTQAIETRQMLYWEADFLRALELNGPFGFSSAVWFQTFGTDITLWILILFTASLSAWKRRPITTLSIVLAYVVIDVVVRFGWMSWDRSRPDIIAQGLAAPGFHSFPSGHTGKTLAVYGFLASVWWRASSNIAERVFILVLMAFIVIIVPLGRLRMGVHWPSDIVGGYTTGMAWLLLLILACRWEKPLRDESRRDLAILTHAVPHRE